MDYIKAKHSMRMEKKTKKRKERESNVVGNDVLAPKSTFHQNLTTIRWKYEYLQKCSLPGYLVRWFVLVIDKANDHKSNILLIGYFNIDLCKPQPTWDTTTSLFGFHQLGSNAARITSTTATLIDHIYTNDQTMVSEVLVSTAGISDHSPIFGTWSFKLLSGYLKAAHL